MNLVKLQDDLRLLPMQALEAKAKGQDPNTPPWLATTVLNERVNAQKNAGLAQGAKGQQPSIVEQLNQKAGLMALQGQQQQQAQQQMVQQAAQAPQPAPEGLPQPESQPEEPTEPQMMARGGIAKLPVDSRMFDYKDGGIIGFASGGDIEQKIEEANKASLRFSGRPLTPQQRADLENKLRQTAAEEAAGAAAGKAGMPLGSIAPEKFTPVKPEYSRVKPTSTQPGGEPIGRGGLASIAPPQSAPPQPQGDVQIPMSPELRAAMEKDAAEQGITNPQFNFQGPRGSTATLTKPQQPPQQPPQEPPQAPAQPAGIASLPAAQEDPLAQAQRFAAAMPKQEKPTFDAVRAERQRALREAGLPEDIGATLKEGIGRYESESERIRNERKEADAIYALSARGGLGEIAERSADRQRINALADTIRNDKANEMRMSMEAARRAEAIGDVAEVRRQTDIYNKAADEQGKAVVTAATQLAQTKAQTETQMAGYGMQAGTAAKGNVSAETIAKLGRDTQKEIANIQARATVLASQGRLDSNEGKLLYQAAEKMVDTARKELEDVMSNPMYRSEVPAKQKALADAKAALMIAAGGKMPTGVDAKVAPPPPGAVREVKK